MAEIHIHFIGQWRLFLEADTVRVNLDGIEEAKNYVDTTYGPFFAKKLHSRGVNKKESVWDNSIVFINGRKIGPSDNTVFKDGDTIKLIPFISGG